MTIDTTLNVVVHYAAAGDPFKDHHADPSKTVGQLKQRVLDFFQLTEGGAADGSVTTYTLYKQKEALTDLGGTLGDLVGHGKALELKLSQQIVQGA
jgi:hypothetical protein